MRLNPNTKVPRSMGVKIACGPARPVGHESGGASGPTYEAKSDPFLQKTLQMGLYTSVNQVEQ
jgi:hypothetical protein